MKRAGGWGDKTPRMPDVELERQEGDKKGRLRKADLRPTVQRVSVCRFVLCEADHPTAEAVKKWTDAHGLKLSLATVYNTLGALVKAGLLRELRPRNGRRVVGAVVRR